MSCFLAHSYPYLVLFSLSGCAEEHVCYQEEQPDHSELHVRIERKLREQIRRGIIDIVFGRFAKIHLKRGILRSEHLELSLKSGSSAHFSRIYHPHIKDCIAGS